MSNRAYKKLLAEKEQLNTDINLDDSDNEQCPKKIPNIFDFLEDVNDSQLPCDDSNISVNHDKTMLKKTKNKLKKNRAKIIKECGMPLSYIGQYYILKDRKDVSDDLLLDKLILENKEHAKVIEIDEPSKEESVLYVQMKNLNPEYEVRRIFGNVTESNSKKSRNPHNKHLVPGICPPKPNWPPLYKIGLIMEQINDQATTSSNKKASSLKIPPFDELGEEEEVKKMCKGKAPPNNPNNYPQYKFKHTHAYQTVEAIFHRVVASMDQEGLMELHEEHPYHINTLLQLNAVMRMSDDYQAASSLIERAICAMETAFHPRFKITDERRLLRYKYRENRCFHIALFYHALYLNKRGCPRTALEICKLLLSLDPSDPLGVLLVIDNYALKAKDYGFILRFYREMNVRYNLTLLPNFAYSVPLAMKLLAANLKIVEYDGKGKSTKSCAGSTKGAGTDLTDQDWNELFGELEVEADSLLMDALVNFPWVLIALLEKLGVQSDDEIVSQFRALIKGRKSPPPVLQRLVNLYVTLNAHTWSSASTSTASRCDTLLWLEDLTTTLLSQTGSEPEPIDVGLIYGTAPVPVNLCRHFFLAEHEENQAPLLPPNSSDSGLSVFDPFPPSDGIDGYKFPSATKSQRSQTTTADVALNTEPLAVGDMVSVVRSFLVSMMPNVRAEELLGTVDRMAEAGELRELTEFNETLPNPIHTGTDGTMSSVYDAFDRVSNLLRLPNLFSTPATPSSVTGENGVASGSGDHGITLIESSNQPPIRPDTQTIGSSQSDSQVADPSTGQAVGDHSENMSGGDGTDNEINVILEGFDNDGRRTQR